MIKFMDGMLENNSDINLVDMDGKTALHHTVVCKRNAVVSHLLRKRANPEPKDLGIDHLRSGILQPSKLFMQGPQPFHQLQMLTPQHQQQLLLVQQDLTSASTNDAESRRL